MSSRPSTIGTRLHANARHNEDALRAYEQRSTMILKAEMPMDAETRELHPSTLAMSAEARETLIQYADDIELAQAGGKEFEAVRGAASKSAEMAARIAGVLTLFANLDAAEVSADNMNDAIALARYYLNEARRLRSNNSLSGEIKDAEELRIWLLEKWHKNELLPSDANQSGPRHLRGKDNKARREAAIDMLLGHGWLLSLPPNSIVRGSRREVAWKIVRKTDLAA